MTTIILIPGGGGSILKLGSQQIWPPDWDEMCTHYNRINELQDPNVTVGGLFESYPPGSLVYVQDVYRTLKSDLDYLASQFGYQRVDFAYDWRLDIRVSAGALANQVATCVQNGSGPVILVCHSMGNLLARWLIESGVFASEPWFSSVCHYVGICGPHYGTPENLEYVAGDKGFLCITPADTKILSANTDYPGPGYQCLPFQNYPGHPLSDVNTGFESFYNTTVATTLGLNLTNLQAAIEMQACLGFSRVPPSVKYSLVAASGQMTDEIVLYDHAVFQAPWTDNQGDGTIPLASANVYGAQVTPGSHIDVLKTYPFRVILYDILSTPCPATAVSMAHAAQVRKAKAPKAKAKSAAVAHEKARHEELRDPKSLRPAYTLGDKPGAAICLNKYVLAPNEPMDILLVPDLETAAISGTLQIMSVKEPTAKPVIYRQQELAYKGPPIRFIRASLAAPADPGGYQITVTDSQGTSQSTGAGFAVSATAKGRRPGGRRSRNR